jgi:hypothetical protein
LILPQTFGNEGRLTLDFAPYAEHATAVAAQGDGKIIVGLWIQELNPGPSSGDFILVRRPRQRQHQGG